ncbi:hypothetical protein F4778DRAFT_335272 [Xylariomycetidae sp. FL2044]|nr:hypothetical protein F4778DRAFT_335272 [Xylariomycetidae sp. FL2044]
MLAKAPLSRCGQCRARYCRRWPGTDRGIGTGNALARSRRPRDPGMIRMNRGQWLSACTIVWMMPRCYSSISDRCFKITVVSGYARVIAYAKTDDAVSLTVTASGLGKEVSRILYLKNDMLYITARHGLRRKISTFILGSQSQEEVTFGGGGYLIFGLHPAGPEGHDVDSCFGEACLQPCEERFHVIFQQSKSPEHIDGLVIRA